LRVSALSAGRVARGRVSRRPAGRRWIPGRDLR